MAPFGIERVKRSALARKTHRRTTRRLLLARLPKRSAGAEIGVDRGDFSSRILAVVRPSVLHLIDPWQYQDTGSYSHTRYGGGHGGDQARMDERYQSVLARFATPITEGRVVVHRATSSEAAASLPSQSLDWVYIDGNHRYEFVLADLEAYSAKIRPGGVIAGDDYTDNPRPENGVKRAVEAFVASGRADFVWHMGRQFLLRSTPG